MTKGMELPNKKKDRDARRNGNLKIHGSGHHQTIGDERRKKKEKSISGERGNYSKPNYKVKNLIKCTSAWAVPFVRYLEPFLKWITEELR